MRKVAAVWGLKERLDYSTFFITMVWSFHNTQFTIQRLLQERERVGSLVVCYKSKVGTTDLVLHVHFPTVVSQRFLR